MTEPTTKRNRGAQPGNLNALQHGYFSRAFTTAELADLSNLDAQLATGLDNEIAMIRVVTRRVLALAEGAKDLDTAMNALGCLGMAATRMAGLLKTQRLLGNDGADSARAISDAIAAVVKELQYA